MELWEAGFHSSFIVICLAKKVKMVLFSMKGLAKQLIDNDLYCRRRVLLPEKEFVSNTVDGYYDIKQLANLYKVSPSAVVMRLSFLI